jgi:Ca2+-binding EF-hand superfamily protein
LSLKELRDTIRGPLQLPERTLCDYDIKLLFEAVDVDGSGDIELEELLEYLQKGKRTAEEEEQLAKTRVTRTRKSITMAFSKLGKNEADLRNLFKQIDADGEGKVSHDEFTTFVRRDLQLNHWNLKGNDLQAFYKALDTDGDGLEVEEFLDFVKKVNHTSDFGKSDTTSSTQKGFWKPARRPTYRQVLGAAVTGSYRLNKSSTTPQLPQMSSFCNLGRSREPASRLHTSKAAIPSRSVSLPALR